MKCVGPKVDFLRLIFCVVVVVAGVVVSGNFLKKSFYPQKLTLCSIITRQLMDFLLLRGG